MFPAWKPLYDNLGFYVFSQSDVTKVFWRSPRCCLGTSNVRTANTDTEREDQEEFCEIMRMGRSQEPEREFFFKGSHITRKFGLLTLPTHLPPNHNVLSSLGLVCGVYTAIDWLLLIFKPRSEKFFLREAIKHKSLYFLTPNHVLSSLGMVCGLHTAIDWLSLILKPNKNQPTQPSPDKPRETIFYP